MPTDRVLDADEVSKVRSGYDPSGTLCADIFALADSHESLRADLAAMTAVARRYRHGWYPWADRSSQGWHLPRARGGQRIGTDEPMTIAELAALDALEANDGD